MIPICFYIEPLQIPNQIPIHNLIMIPIQMLIHSPIQIPTHIPLHITVNIPIHIPIQIPFRIPVLIPAQIPIRILTNHSTYAHTESPMAPAWKRFANHGLGLTIIPFDYWINRVAPDSDLAIRIPAHVVLAQTLVGFFMHLK